MVKVELVGSWKWVGRRIKLIPLLESSEYLVVVLGDCVSKRGLELGVM